MEEVVEGVDVTMGCGGRARMSRIFGGGAMVGGPAFRKVPLFSLPSCECCKWRRSGELPPCGIAPSGTRAGMRDGLRLLFVVDAVAAGILVTVPTGVFERSVAGSRVDATRGPDDPIGFGAFAGAGRALGVFDLGGSTFAEEPVAGAVASR